MEEKMNKHPDNCQCADCVPNWPDTSAEDEQQRQKDMAEQLAAIAPTPPPAKN
jgi:hypothetical protein